MTSSNPPARHDTGTDQLLAEVAGPVAVVTFNNPGKRNALSSGMRAALPGLLEALQADDDIRVVVVTGAGDKAFASGADISEFADRRTSPEARAEYDRVSAALSRSWHDLGKPLIAMIRGFCIGGGLFTALQADIRVASDDSQFGVPAARLGLGPGFAGVTALTSLVGPSWAAEILFSARRFPAAEALQMGLVNRVVPAASLRDEVMGLAQSIAQNAPLTVAASKAAIREARRSPGRRDPARVEAMIEACFQSDDYREGQRAFAESARPPSPGGELAPGQVRVPPGLPAAPVRPGERVQQDEPGHRRYLMHHELVILRVDLVDQPAAGRPGFNGRRDRRARARPAAPPAAGWPRSSPRSGRPSRCWRPAAVRAGGGSRSPARG